MSNPEDPRKINGQVVPESSGTTGDHPHRPLVPAVPLPIRGTAGGTPGQQQPLWQLEKAARRRRAATPDQCTACGAHTLTGPDADDDDLPNDVVVDDTRLTRLGMYQALTSGVPVITVRLGKHGQELNRLATWARPNPDDVRVAPIHTCGTTYEVAPLPPRPNYDGTPPY